MPKTYVNLSYDRRGWPELYKHVVEQLQNGGFNPGSLELNFNGNPIQSKDDITFLKKIIPLFRNRNQSQSAIVINRNSQSYSPIVINRNPQAHSIALPNRMQSHCPIAVNGRVYRCVLVSYVAAHP